MLLKVALEKILSETNPAKNADLREACQEAIEKLKNEKKSFPDADEGANEGQQGAKVNGDKYWGPFKLALKSQNPKIIETALDSIQKLLAFHIMKGTTTVQKGDVTVKLIDEIIEAVCACFIGAKTEEGIQLQIIKCLLTAVTSPLSEVHSAALTKVIQTCFNIFLLSKNIVNQVTAKASLTQIVNLVFQRMERFALLNSKAPAQEKDKEKEEKNPEAGVNGKEEGSNGVDDAVAGVHEEYIGPPGKYGFCITCSKKADHYCSQTKDPVCSKECKLKNLERIEREQKLKVLSPTAEKAEPAGLNQEEVLRKDVEALFSLICHLSKPLDEEVLSPDVTQGNEVRGRILALELLLSVLTNPGPVFKNGEVFIALVRKDLCIPLSKNGVSPNASLFELSLSIFLTLLSHFKAPLKNEIQVLFKDIFLKVLQVPTSTHQQKVMVLQGLAKICSNPQTLVDFYLNYDCGVVSDDVFQSLVNEIAKVTKNKTKVEGQELQANKIRLKGLKCLVSVINSFLEWNKDVQTENSSLVKEANHHDDKDAEVSFVPTIPSKNPLSGVTLSTQQAPATDTDSPDQFEEMRTKKLVLRQGIEKFNEKPFKGIAFLQEAGVLDATPESVANFLKTTPGLGKQAIGTVLGDEKPASVKILHAFVDSLDFAGLTFTTALRRFLQTFRLPGEAQKIDRIVEKFADRFCENNAEVFANADTAYTLAFSVIMLNTDLHSHQIKVKMTKPQFIKNNRGINNGGDVDPAYLEEIYDDILNEEIVLMEEQTAELAKAAAGGQLTEKQRSDLYKMEMEQLTRKLLAGQNDGDKFHYHSGSGVQHVKPMFLCTWKAIMEALSSCFEDFYDDEFVQACMDGFQGSIRFCCLFSLSAERETLVQVLSQFAFVTSLNGMVPKDLSAIHTLLNVAYENANAIMESWIHVLQCISRMESLHLIGSGAVVEITNSEPYDPKKGNQISNLLQLVKKFQSQATAIAIDKIFASSGSLDGKSIAEFIKCLCTVSLEEVNSQDELPRMFSMQKIVEIAYYNMNRIRFEWTLIWQVLLPYFNTIGCHNNATVATFAVDSLRQLSMKFLEKDELAHFHGQAESMRPFEHIMKWNRSFTIRDYALKSMEQMVRARAQNIKSGWKSIFVVVSRAAQEAAPDLVKSAFAIVQLVLNEFFEHVSSCFVDFISCLVEFAFNKVNEDLALSSIHLLQKCAKLVQDHPLEPPGMSVDDFFLRWFPILSGLSRIVIDCESLNVRKKALDTLFVLLSNSGANFDVSYWRAVFRSVLHPIFEDLKDPDAKKHEIPSTIWIQALKHLIDLYSSFSAVLSQNGMLDNILEFILTFVTQKNESLAKSGALCLHHIISANAKIFTEKDWEAVTTLVDKCFDQTTPRELVIDKAIKKPPPASVKSSVLVHLELIKALKELTLTSDSECIRAVPSVTKTLWLKCLFDSFTFSQEFNDDHDLRLALVHSGFVEKMPNLNQQETTSILAYLQFTFRLFREFTEAEYSSEGIMVEKSVMVLKSYQTYLADPKKHEREIALWSPIIVIILQEVISLDWQGAIAKHLPAYFKLVTDLMLAETPTVRKVLQEFMEKIATKFFS